MTPVIEVNALRKVYPAPGGDSDEFVAVQGVTFCVRAGGSLGIVGESGAGKSTVARMLVGLEQPTGGSILVAGTDRTETTSAAERKRRARETQLVFQDPHGSLDPRQPVGRALDEMLRFHLGLTALERRERINQLLRNVGLTEKHAAALPRNLSGGQVQRVAIARALSVEPKVLVLDEAVAALDVSIQAQVLNLLRDIRERMGVAYIFISHDLGVIRYATDDVVVMRHGEVIEQGRTSQVLDAPRHPYTRTLRDSVPHPGWTPRRVLAANATPCAKRRSSEVAAN